MGWAFLFIAGLLEIAMALALKSSAGWTRLLPSALGIAAAVASVFFLTHALNGVAYAIWTGMGSVGVALIGILWLGEQATPLRLGCIGLIVAGMIGLRLSDPTV